MTTTQPNPPPSYSNPERASFVGLSQKTLNLNVVSNERHLKMSIGSELGAKAWIGHGYAAAHFHRITLDSAFSQITLDAKIFFSRVYSVSPVSL